MKYEVVILNKKRGDRGTTREKERKRMKVWSRQKWRVRRKRRGDGKGKTG